MHSNHTENNKKERLGTKSTPNLLDIKKQHCKPAKHTPSTKHIPIKDPELKNTSDHDNEPPRWLVFGLQFLAYAIPLSFLVYVLYINYLPFGYDKTFVIDVGSEGDTDSSQVFYLQPSADLSERKTSPDGSTYRELDGMAYAIFKPNVVLKDAEITVEVEGDGVSIIPPVIDFDPDTVDWDYEWDFTKGIPNELEGDAFRFGDCATYFTNDTRLSLQNSSQLFEKGSFVVYVEWVPENNKDDFQQIIGHFNWEIKQDSDSVTFQVGRMNDSQGGMYYLKYPITNNFFNKRHALLATYYPSEDGYIELYVDNTFAGRERIGSDVMWTEYWDRDLSFGKSDHGFTNYFQGCLLQARIHSGFISQTKKEIQLNGTPDKKTYEILIEKTNDLATKHDLSTISAYVNKQ